MNDVYKKKKVILKICYYFVFIVTGGVKIKELFPSTSLFRCFFQHPRNVFHVWLIRNVEQCCLIFGPLESIVF